MVILATPTAVKVTGVILGSPTPESRRQRFPVTRIPGKQFGTPKHPQGPVPKTTALTHEGC